MPQYSFRCPSCTLCFDRTLSMGEHPQHPCPAGCPTAAIRQFKDASFAHAFTEAPNKPLANTGVHADDYPTADRAVGRSAEKRWGHFNARAEIKKQAREAGGTHALARRDNAEGTFTDYAPLTTTGLDARKGLAKETMKAFDTARAAAAEKKKAG